MNNGKETAGLRGWLDYGTALYRRSGFQEGKRDAIALDMARNAKEGVQYILTADRDVDGLRCEAEPLSDGAGHTLSGRVFVAWYTMIRSPDAVHPGGYTPTALLEQDDPYQGGTFDVKAGTARTLYLLYRTGETTVPGTYTGTMTIRKDGETLLTGAI